MKAGAAEDCIQIKVPRGRRGKPALGCSTGALDLSDQQDVSSTMENIILKQVFTVIKKSVLCLRC